MLGRHLLFEHDLSGYDGWPTGVLVAKEIMKNLATTYWSTNRIGQYLEVVQPLQLVCGRVVGLNPYFLVAVYPPSALPVCPPPPPVCPSRLPPPPRLPPRLPHPPSTPIQ